jgi:hypothetical protein
MGMLISIIADRFASSETLDALRLAEVADGKQSDGSRNCPDEYDSE